MKNLFSSLLVLAVIMVGAYCQGVEYGWSCSNDCRADLDCVGGRCACRYPRHQVYNNTLGLCESLLFGPCITTVDGVCTDIPCVANTECKNENGFSECACRPGTRQVGRSCRAMFGEACSTNSDCHNPSSFSDNPIICLNGRCDCGTLETFNEATGTCVGLVGAMCGTGSVCVEGAACERFDSFDGTCRCTGAFQATPDRRCESAQCFRV